MGTRGRGALRLGKVWRSVGKCICVLACVGGILQRGGDVTSIPAGWRRVWMWVVNIDPGLPEERE